MHGLHYPNQLIMYQLSNTAEFSFKAVVIDKRMMREYLASLIIINCTVDGEHAQYWIEVSRLFCSVHRAYFGILRTEYGYREVGLPGKEPP
jgi:hypothetical protein